MSSQKPLLPLHYKMIRAEGWREAEVYKRLFFIVFTRLKTVCVVPPGCGGRGKQKALFFSFPHVVLLQLAQPKKEKKASRCTAEALLKAVHLPDVRLVSNCSAGV